jgi:CO/xanthine dehydrogenase Mo-binding subunit
VKFGIGQPMRRHEDLRLITGRGRYTDDIILPRMTHGFMLRSPVAHAHDSGEFEEVMDRCLNLSSDHR